MEIRALSVGIIGILASISACTVDEFSAPEEADDVGELSDALGATPPRDAAHSPFYTSRVDMFPQGNCGQAWKLNEWNNPYTLRWLDSSSVQISLRDPVNPANSCRHGDSDDAAGAKCAQMITDARKIIFPIEWNDSSCLTAAQKTKLDGTSSWKTIEIGDVMMTAPGTTTEVDVGQLRLYRSTDGAGTKRYESNMLASTTFLDKYNSSTFAVNNGIGLSNLNGAKLRFRYSSSNIPLNGRTALSCASFADHNAAVSRSTSTTTTVGRWQYNSSPTAATGWQPMFGRDSAGNPVRRYTAYSFVDVYTHAWCPTSFAPHPGYPVQ